MGGQATTNSYEELLKQLTYQAANLSNQGKLPVMGTSIIKPQ